MCGILVEPLDSSGEFVTPGRHAPLATIWQSGATPPDLQRSVIIPLWNGKGQKGVAGTSGTSAIIEAGLQHTRQGVHTHPCETHERPPTGALEIKNV